VARLQVLQYDRANISTTQRQMHLDDQDLADAQDLID